MIIAAIGIIGFTYQYVAAARDRKLYPPPGQLVDVGGYRLHLYCVGKGSPTVVLEAGSGGKGVIAWALVQNQIATATQARVCSYDRAGFGWSDPDPADQPRSSVKVAETLHTLLHNARIDGPYVLVDAVTENYYLIYPFDPTEVFFDDIGFRYCHVMTAIGVTRLFGETRLTGPLGLTTSERGRYPLPASLYQADLANRNRTSYCRALANEEKANRKEETQSTPPRSLGDLPLVVLTAGTDPTWGKLQEELASLSTRSEHIVVENGEHFLQFFQPEVVITTVEKLVHRVQPQGSTLGFHTILFGK